MGAKQKIMIPRLTWMRLVQELRKRGKGRSESGAFLLGNVDAGDRRVETFICYDDLDPDALSSGYVTFHGEGFSALWEICKKEKLRVIADVHTHPTEDVRQSRIDKSNPMVPVVGHVAIILPNYACTSKFSITGAGVHVFKGHGQWTSYFQGHTDNPVSLCTF
jgi:proteasome lid subunit RPN8/RPN11